MAARQFRVGGSRFTTFEWDGAPIAHANQVAHTSPAAVANPVAIQPLDSRRPQEVITANAIGMGTLVLEIIELYGEPVWKELVSLAKGGTKAIPTGLIGQQGPNNVATASTSGNAASQNNATDLADIFNVIASTPNPITVVKYVNPPAGSKKKAYFTTFHNCVISDYQDDETIAIGTMQLFKQLTVNYTHYITTFTS